MAADPLQELWPVIFTVNAVAVLSGMIINVVLQRRIKALNPTRWKALGSPTLFSNNSIGGSWKFLRYIYGAGHFELNDPLVNRLALASKLLFLFICFILCSIMASIFWAWHLHPLSVQGTARPPSSPNHPLNRYGAAILAIFAASYAISAWFLRYLKRAHTQTWEELGSPSAFLNNTIANSWKVSRFVWSGQHKNLADPKLSLAIYGMRLCYGVVLAAFFILGPLAAK